ncbi:hypothetical protein RA210_U10042 [Rubrivivax sp. A210]|nr:hypothetical protein [Rubrivivax sp. A210]CAD5365894.1 hypothetical protein RA210_U10042 [Rubrivivax sp. A210]
MVKKNHGNKEAKKPKREAPAAKPPVTGLSLPAIAPLAKTPHRK